MGTGTFGIHIQHCRTLSWCTHGCEERGKGHQADYLTCARITDDQDYSRNIDGTIQHIAVKEPAVYNVPIILGNEV